jgi:hypothetical protein
MTPKELMVRFLCPQCKRPLKSPARTRGQLRRCPHCKDGFEVPARSLVPVTTEVDLPESLPIASPETPVANAESPPATANPVQAKVPLSLKVSNVLGLETSVTQGTANSIVKMIVTALIVLFGVIVGARCGVRPQKPS